MSISIQPEVEDDEPSTLAARQTPKQPEPRKISRTLINFWLAAALFIAIVLLIWVSAMLEAAFPAPTSAQGWKLWGLTYDQWRETQFVARCVCSLLALEHVVLHWNCVCVVIGTQVLRLGRRPAEGNQSNYGVAMFIGIVAILLTSILSAILTVQPPPR
jgi:hypothetical protein